MLTVHNGQNSIGYYGPLIRSMIPGYIKDSETLDIFKGKIRKWKPINCTCRYCKKYIPNLGFINQSFFFMIQYFCFQREVYPNYEVTLNAWLTQSEGIFHASYGCNQSVFRF